MSGEATFSIARLATRVLIWTAVVVLLAPTGRAEVRLSAMLEGLLKPPPTEESLADEYGQAVITELATLMSQRMDTACLKSRPQSQAALKKVAGDILLRYGRKAMAIRFPEIEYTQVEAVFAKIAGPQAVADLRVPTSIDAMRRYQFIILQHDRVGVVEFITDGFDRYLENANLALGQALDPVISGNRELTEIKMRSEGQFAGELNKALSNDAAMRLLVKHLDAIDSAYRQIVLARGVDPDYIAHTGFAGVEVDLRNACVRLGK
jgi:hypothetical protein